MSKWVGFAVSVNCGNPLGCYQGTILETDGNTITLTKAFRNGFPYPKSQVTINAADIKELKIIEAKSSGVAPEQSTVALSKTGKKPPRATVCENLQANNAVTVNNATTNSSGNKSARGVPRSKPIDITPARHKPVTHAGSGGGGGSTPKGRSCAGGGCGVAGGGVGGAARRRNEACFGASASPADDDFDFEGNLALFDKRATFHELRNKPDLLKQVNFVTEEKFRHDENVLGGSSGGTGSADGTWRVPLHIQAGSLRTDSGAALPAVTSAARATLYRALCASPAGEAAAVLLGRAAADVALKLAGGPRRLDHHNKHQTPSVAALVTDGVVAAAAVLAARLLHSQGARACVATITPPTHPALCRELAAAAACLPPAVTSPAQLPAADVILLALHDPLHPDNPPCVEVVAALRWARAARALVVALEPCTQAWGGAGAARASLAALLPPRLPPALGQLYLVDVAPPPSLFREIDVSERPPFGASAVIALHPDDDDQH